MNITNVVLDRLHITIQQIISLGKLFVSKCIAFLALFRILLFLSIRTFFKTLVNTFSFCCGLPGQGGFYCYPADQKCQLKGSISSVLVPIYRAFLKALVNTLQLLLWPSCVGRVLLLTPLPGKPVKRFNLLQCFFLSTGLSSRLWSTLFSFCCGFLGQVGCYYHPANQKSQLKG